MTPAQLEALCRLRASGDFKQFLEVTREYEHDLNERLIGAKDPVLMHQSQGGIAALRALIREVHDAPETLQKMTQRKTP